MKWTKSEILNQGGNITFDEDIEINPEVFSGNVRINGVSEAHVSGRGWLDEESDCFYCKLRVDGVMLVPDAITGQELEYPFDSESDETYAFGDTEAEDARLVGADETVDLLPAVMDVILMEVPMDLTDADEDEYPEGEGWKVYSEAAYEKSREDQTDPRLAVLKNFKNDDKN
jgi:uncharacterized protein